MSDRPSNAIEKTCRILCSLTDPKVRRMTDIAEATGINRVSVLRILNTLMAEKLVHRDETSKEYCYGPELHYMAASLNARLDLRTAARPSIARLAAMTGDTVQLVVKSGLECVCLERESGDFPIHASSLFVGSRRPLGIGSGPLAVLSWLDPDEQEQALAYTRPRLRRYPGLTVTRLRQAIVETRDRGYALVIGEVQAQIGALAMIIPDAQGRTIAALSMSMLKERIRGREEWMAQILSKEVALVRAALRGPGAQLNARPSSEAASRGTQPAPPSHRRSRPGARSAPP
jgi:DNA-binding IclR family transcriptional regulator